jgi:hypothetical protein
MSLSKKFLNNICKRIIWSSKNATESEAIIKAERNEHGKIKQKYKQKEKYKEKNKKTDKLDLEDIKYKELGKEKPPKVKDIII